MMSWPIDEILQEMASDHIGIMDLPGELEFGCGYMQDAHKYSPYINDDEEDKVHEAMEGEKEDEDVIRY